MTFENTSHHYKIIKIILKTKYIHASKLSKINKKYLFIFWSELSNNHKTFRNNRKPKHFNAVAPDDFRDIEIFIYLRQSTLTLKRYIKRELEHNLNNLFSPSLKRNTITHETLTRWRKHITGCRNMQRILQVKK